MTRQDIQYLRHTYDCGPEYDCLLERNYLIEVLKEIVNPGPSHGTYSEEILSCVKEAAREALERVRKETPT